MQVLPYLIILAILPQIQGCKNIKAKIIKREGNKLTAENLYQALEILMQLQMQMKIIMEKIRVREKEDFLKKLSKKEKYKNRRFLTGLW